MRKILQGDCLEILPTLEDNSIDAVITDIPYGIGYEDWDVLHDNTNSALGGASEAQKEKGGLYKRRGKPLNGWSAADREISREYQEWCTSWASECMRVLKPGGSCIIFAGRRYAPRCVVALEDIGFTFKEMLAWEKTKAPHRAQRLSEIYRRRGDTENEEKWSGWRVANPRPIFEPILWFQKPYKIGGTIANNVLEWGVGAWNDGAYEKWCVNAEGVRDQSNIIMVASDKLDTGLHPTQKPMRLMQFLVDLVTPEREDVVVLDPFCGSATTCVAAQSLGRDFIGIERDGEMWRIACERCGISAES